jgi:hypothetical protein
MYPTPKLIKESDLPLKSIGYEKETNNEVFALTGMINVDIRLSFKSYGYIHCQSTLVTGEKIEDCWVKKNIY